MKGFGEKISSPEQKHPHSSRLARRICAIRLPAKGAKCMLEQIFQRLYVARNQVFHGSHSGDTDSSNAARQVGKGADSRFFDSCFPAELCKMSAGLGTCLFSKAGKADGEMSAALLPGAEILAPPRCGCRRRDSRFRGNGIIPDCLRSRWRLEIIFRVLAQKKLFAGPGAIGVKLLFQRHFALVKNSDVGHVLTPMPLRLTTKTGVSAKRFRFPFCIDGV